MKELNHEEKYEYWRMVIEEFESSGKTIKEQCLENDIPFAKYYDWRKKIRTNESSEESTFIEVEEAPLKSKKADVDSGVTLEYGSDYKITLSDSFKPEVLSSVLQVLKNTCSQ